MNHQLRLSVTVFFPGADEGCRLRVLELHATTSVQAVLTRIVKENLFAAKNLDWPDKPKIYHPDAFAWSEDENDIIRRVNEWWSTTPTPLAALLTLEECLPLARPTKIIDLIVMTEKRPSSRQTRAVSIASKAPRVHLVNFLFETVREQKFFLVRGTPGSGKTVLCTLLYNHLLATENTLVSWLGPWRETHSIAASFDASLLRGDPVDLNNTELHWLLFDDGQSTYGDATLWLTVLKEIPNNLRVVVFTSYGNQKDRIASEMGTRNNILPHQRMGVYATTNGNQAGTMGHIPGLYFAWEEYVTFLDEQSRKPDHPVLDHDLRQWVHWISAGHIGAIDSILTQINVVAKDAGRRSTMTLAQFLLHFDSPDVALIQCANGNAFDRGLPNSLALANEKNTGAVNFIRLLLESNPLSYSPHEVPKDVLHAHKLGWITLEEVTLSTVTATFPSPFHQSRVSYLLDGSKDPSPRVQSMTLLDFIQAVVGSFSKNALRFPEQHTTGTYATPSIPEAQWQNEFYRSAYKVTGGQGLWLSPEFGTEQTSRAGRIDFFICGSKRWGIELLREGDRLDEHLRRFETGGAYHRWIQNGNIKEYVLLDFRAHTTPRKFLPQGTCLYRITFDRPFNHFEIKDAQLKVLCSGSLLA